jgi:hypothetical protein
MYNQTYITCILLSLDYWASLTRDSTHLYWHLAKSSVSPSRFYLAASTHVPKPKLQTYNRLFGQISRTCCIQQVKQVILSEGRWRTPEDEDQGKHDREKLSRLVDGDFDPEGMAVLLVVTNLEVYARGRSLFEFGQLLHNISYLGESAL